ncbi:MAG: hypothetical protein LM558_01500, partial [Thermosphaera sp.]|nr:hypothetical protein [Thermosphaera sp.]
VEARTDKLFYEPAPRDGVVLYVTVRASGLAVDKVNVTVDWGDGTRSYQVVPVGKETIICAPPPPSPITTIADLISGGTCWKKLYYVSGDEARRGVFFTISVNATYKNLLRGSNSVVIYVRELPGLPFPFSGLSGYVNTVLSLLSGGMLDANRLLYSPVFRLDGPEGAWYNRTLTLAVMLLPVFMLFRIAPGLAYDPGRAIVDGFRDVALAVIAMMLIPHAYNVTANALNTFTDGIGGSTGATIIAQLAGSAIAWGGLFILISLASPGAGFIGGALLMAVALVAILGIVRWFLLQAIVIASPLLVLAWLHPTLRGAANQFYNMVGAMMLAGPVTALFLLLFAGAFFEGNILKVAGGSFALSLAGIFVVGFIPQVLSFLFVTGLERIVAARIEATATRAVPQMGKAVLAGGARGLATGATMAGKVAYARAMRVKPIADAMRAGGVMVGKARETLSRAVTGLQKGLENRVARVKSRFTGASARLGALTSLKKGYKELHELNQRTKTANNRLVDAMRYYDELGPEEQQDPEKMLPLALARMEYDALAEARAEKEEQLKEQLSEYYEANLIKGDEHRNLKNLLRTPQSAIGTLNKMIEEQEHEVQMREAELKRDRATHGRFAKAIGGLGEAPARLKKIIGDALTVPRKLGEKREGARGAGVVVVIKVKERA